MDIRTYVCIGLAQSYLIPTRHLFNPAEHVPINNFVSTPASVHVNIFYYKCVHMYT